MELSTVVDACTHPPAPSLPCKEGEGRNIDYGLYETLYMLLIHVLTPRPPLYFVKRGREEDFI
jgi:hypothetical protein